MLQLPNPSCPAKLAQKTSPRGSLLLFWISIFLLLSCYFVFHWGDFVPSPYLVCSKLEGRTYVLFIFSSKYLWQPLKPSRCLIKTYCLKPKERISVSFKSQRPWARGASQSKCQLPHDRNIAEETCLSLCEPEQPKIPFIIAALSPHRAAAKAVQAVGSRAFQTVWGKTNMFLLSSCGILQWDFVPRMEWGKQLSPFCFTQEMLPWLPWSGPLRDHCSPNSTAVAFKPFKQLTEVCLPMLLLHDAGIKGMSHHLSLTWENT